jgi:hypothetical protein
MGDQLQISTKTAFPKREQIPNSIYAEHTLILQMNHLFQSVGLCICEGDKAQSEFNAHISLQRFSNNLCACVNVFVPEWLTAARTYTFQPKDSWIDAD